jgi:hypothetical protein
MPTHEPGSSVDARVSDAGAAPPRTEDDLLAEFLQQREVLCPVCGYNLRGVRSIMCPECGARLDLRIGSIDLRLKYWLTSVLAIAIPLGFTTVMSLVAFVAMMLGEFSNDNDWTMAISAWLPTAGLVVLLTTLICKRQRFLRQPKPSQRWLMTLTFAAGIILGGVFFIGLMVVEWR